MHDMYQQGLRYKKSGDYQKMEECFKAAVEEGHVGAMYSLAFFNEENGYIDEAVELYHKAANKDHALGEVF